MQLNFSFIIPVFNRPDEVEELLHSFTQLDGDCTFEIVIVEDGSTIKCDTIINKFKELLNIKYLYKKNTGPGDSRNHGMQEASGNYFIILDSDVILPSHYLLEVNNSLLQKYTDCFGGPDAAHKSFTLIQKAINFSMTSFITTGGIRGKANSVAKFEPRSFNMGLSKLAFQASNGFGRIHPGEDPDLSIRLNKLGFKTKLIPDAYVYHKRRISWSKFYKQVNKFGLVRPILNKRYPETRKLTYWFPSLFLIGLIASFVFMVIGWKLPILVYFTYFVLVFLLALLNSKNILVAGLAIVAVLFQFLGYGYGFLKASIRLALFNKSEEELFPNLFFTK